MFPPVSPPSTFSSAVLSASSPHCTPISSLSPAVRPHYVPEKHHLLSCGSLSLCIAMTSLLSFPLSTAELSRSFSFLSTPPSASSSRPTFRRHHSCFPLPMFQSRTEPLRIPLTLYNSRFCLLAHVFILPYFFQSLRCHSVERYSSS